MLGGGVKHQLKKKEATNLKDSKGMWNTGEDTEQ